MPQVPRILDIIHPLLHAAGHVVYIRFEHRRGRAFKAAPWACTLEGDIDSLSGNLFHEGNIESCLQWLADDMVRLAWKTPQPEEIPTTGDPNDLRAWQERVVDSLDRIEDILTKARDATPPKTETGETP